METFKNPVWSPSLTLLEGEKSGRHRLAAAILQGAQTQAIQTFLVHTNKQKSSPQVQY